MNRKRTSCVVCEYQPLNVGGWWTFMPFFCCETKPVRRTTQHRKRNR